MFWLMFSIVLIGLGISTNVNNQRKMDINQRIGKSNWKLASTEERKFSKIVEIGLDNVWSTKNIHENQARLRKNLRKKMVAL